MSREIRSQYLKGLQKTLLNNVKGRYGEDSEIARFVEDYEVTKGKALVERAEVPMPAPEPEQKKKSNIRVVDYKNVVVASLEYGFGQIVLVRREAPAYFVCSCRTLEGVHVRLYIVDENEIYAAKR